MATWIKLATMLIKLFELYSAWKSKRNAAKAIDDTTAKQVNNGKIINALNKKERVLRNHLDSIDSLRQRAEAINKSKNSDM